MAFPQAPPETIPEKYLYVYVGSHIDVISIRQDHDERRRRKYDRRGQGNSYVYATCAIVGIGLTIASAKRIAPKISFFIFLPPLSVVSDILPDETCFLTGNIGFSFEKCKSRDYGFPFLRQIYLPWFLTLA
jgi:hypothetical protein